MTLRLLFLFTPLIFLLQPVDSTAQLQSPEEFLGYELGDRYTPHHKVMSYVKHVSEESDRVNLQTYGNTYEHRELNHLIVTTPANHQRIDEIRTNNLKRIGLMEGDPTDLSRAITWLSFNIHGNETSSSEAALKTLYELADPDNQEAESWLATSVVIIDPMVNPDGRDRYVNWFNGITGSEYDPKVDAREHHEPWPGGRSNHYYFDLNRDWAWQTQVESQQRNEIYQQWMPHIHVDFHEQGYNSPYYFAPAAEPFHEAITDWQREFQTTIGENHIRYFDEEGWHYFTKERFDLFYPSYGDTWPTYNGAIGMTYEQAGGGLGAAAVITQEGDTLTLKNRLTHHATTALSTVEVTAEHSGRVVEEFEKYFTEALEEPSGRYKSYVVKGDNHPDKIYNLLTFLDNQQIEYSRASSSRNTDGYNYTTGRNERLSVDEGDVVISAYQPKSRLARVFFEPNPALSDSLTYDITAWEAHYRFGLEGFATEARITGEEISPDHFRQPEVTGADRPYAYIAEWSGMDDARFLADILQHGVKSRFSTIPFSIDGRDYDRGTLVITRDNNRNLGDDFDRIVRDAAARHSRSLHGASSGYVSEGSDFGSSNVAFIEKPEIALFMGDGTSSLSAGEVWHFFDQQLNYPATLFHTDHFNRVDLQNFNTIVLPGGSYSAMLSDNGRNRLADWVRDGGTLISVGSSVAALSGIDAFQIQRKSGAETTTEEDHSDRLTTYEERNRLRVMNSTPGSIFKTTLDRTHPLAFGYPGEYYSLKTSADAYQYLAGGWNVGTVREDAWRSGFAGQTARQNLEESLTFGVQNVGSGRVVYMVDNPLFRGFWENGKLFFVNALFFTGQ